MGFAAQRQTVPGVQARMNPVPNFGSLAITILVNFQHRGSSPTIGQIFVD